MAKERVPATAREEVLSAFINDGLPIMQAVKAVAGDYPAFTAEQIYKAVAHMKEYKAHLAKLGGKNVIPNDAVDRVFEIIQSEGVGMSAAIRMYIAECGHDMNEESIRSKIKRDKSLGDAARSAAKINAESLRAKMMRDARYELIKNGGIEPKTNGFNNSDYREFWDMSEWIRRGYVKADETKKAKSV
jgi:hypothetical protein|nr:MAG TPA: hypothetical protein [Caudoviricetes sp.]